MGMTTLLSRVFKNETGTVGHVPKEYSRMFHFFLMHCGRITYEVTGHRKKGHGLEVPCNYNLTGDKKMVMKARKIVEDIEKKNLIILTLHLVLCIVPI